MHAAFSSIDKCGLPCLKAPPSPPTLSRGLPAGAASGPKQPANRTPNTPAESLASPSETPRSDSVAGDTPNWTPRSDDSEGGGEDVDLEGLFSELDKGAKKAKDGVTVDEDPL